MKRELTRLQKRLVKDLDEIMHTTKHDYWNILDRHPKWDKDRTILLQGIMREIIRGEVITQYTLLDEQLGSEICHYVFPDRPFDNLWKTRKFERFNYFVLEKMSLMEKLAFVKDVYIVRNGVAADIEAINAVRNALAHAFYPENLRAYRTKSTSYRKWMGPHYKGIDIFTLRGIERFLEDSRRVCNFLIKDARRNRHRKQHPLPPTTSGYRAGETKDVPPPEEGPKK